MAAIGLSSREYSEVTPGQNRDCQVDSCVEGQAKDDRCARVWKVGQEISAGRSRARTRARTLFIAADSREVSKELLARQPSFQVLMIRDP